MRPLQKFLVFGAIGWVAVVGFAVMAVWTFKGAAEHRETWRDAQVVRVCADGTTIWKWRDGTLRVAGGYEVAGLEVCK